MSACPDDSLLFALVEGRLDEPELSSVDEHFDSCIVCREVVASLAESERAPFYESPGDFVGRFVIKGKVGEGASGVVYAAEDPTLERTIALKILHPKKAQIARLTREGQTMARLSHPNVVTVHEVGESNGRLFVAMELVEGQTLRAWLKTNPKMDAVQAALKQAGEGLLAAHQAAIVHRDFKPENVLVGVDGRVKVTDFGLARPDPNVASWDGAAKAGSLTETGALLGTPVYMAPEQLRGASVDERADVFAFAVTCWEALTGSRPFEGATVAELEASIEHGPRLASVAEKLPRRVERALRRALASNPEHRETSVEPLLGELGAKPRRGSYAMLAAAGLMAAGTLIGATFLADESDPCAASRAGLSGWHEGTRHDLRLKFTAAAPEYGAIAADRVIERLDRWAARFNRSRVDVCEATHVRHEQSPAMLDRRSACLARSQDTFSQLVSRFGAADAEFVASSFEATRILPSLETCDAPALRSDAPAPLAAEGDAVAQLTRALDRISLLRTAGKAMEALEELEQLGPPATTFGPALARLDLERAEVLIAVGNYAAAESAGGEALVIAQRGSDRLSEARAWMILARIAGERGQYDEARRVGRNADAVVAGLGDPDELRASMSNFLGVLYTETGDLEEARVQLVRALDLREEERENDPPAYAGVLSNLGSLLREEGDFQSALTKHREALAIEEQVFGPMHPRLGRHHHNIGGVLRRQGKNEQALTAYHRALTIKRSALGSHPDVALTLNSLGLMADQRGDEEAALNYYQEALEMFTRYEHVDAALVRLNLSLLLTRNGHPEDALGHLLAARITDETRFGRDSARVAHEIVAEGDAHFALGDRGQAEASYREALAVAERVASTEMIRKATAGLELLEATAARDARTAVARTAVARTAITRPAIAMVAETSPVPAMRVSMTPGGSGPAGSGPGTPLNWVYGADPVWE